MSETTSATLRVVIDGDRHALPAGLSVLDALRFIGDRRADAVPRRPAGAIGCMPVVPRPDFGLSRTDAGLHDKADRRYGDLDSYA